MTNNIQETIRLQINKKDKSTEIVKAVISSIRKEPARYQMDYAYYNIEKHCIVATDTKQLIIMYLEAFPMYEQVKMLVREGDEKGFFISLELVKDKLYITREKDNGVFPDYETIIETRHNYTSIDKSVMNKEVELDLIIQAIAIQSKGIYNLKRFKNIEKFFSLNLVEMKFRNERSPLIIEEENVYLFLLMPVMLRV